MSVTYTIRRPFNRHNIYRVQGVIHRGNVKTCNYQIYRRKITLYAECLISNVNDSLYVERKDYFLPCECPPQSRTKLFCTSYIFLSNFYWHLLHLLAMLSKYVYKFCKRRAKFTKPKLSWSWILQRLAAFLSNERMASYILYILLMSS